MIFSISPLTAAFCISGEESDSRSSAWKVVMSGSFGVCGLGPCRGYSVRKCRLVFPYPTTPDAKFRCLTLHLRRLLLNYPNNHYQEIACHSASLLLILGIDLEFF